MPSKQGEAERAGKSAGRCPVCRQPADHKYRPFCSRRCADVDLARWLSGTYSIAGSVEDDPAGDDEGLRAGKARHDPEDDMEVT
jgi:hypothetical protein